jgi:hypothetical protein
MSTVRPSVNPAPPASLRSWRRGFILAGTALALTLVHTAFACLVSGVPLTGGAYEELSRWDSRWYARIASQGYPEDLPAEHERERMNHLGFFPGYPLWVRAVMGVTRLPARTATLVAAQLACWGFWVYFLLFLRRGGVPPPLQVAAVFLVVVHPSAFFLIAGYSESLFLLAALGYLYWSSVRGLTGWIPTALHGIVMTATRIVGLPIAACPLILAVAGLRGGEGRWREVVRAALLCGVASLGALLFFAFCQAQYGRWDAYMYAQKAGWEIHPDYLAVFKLSTYRPEFDIFLPGGALNTNALSRLSVPLTALALVVVILAELWLGRGTPAEGRHCRVGLLLAAGLMFYIALSGLANSDFKSMVRYTFCVHVTLVLAVASLLAQVPRVRVRVQPVLPLLFVPALGSAWFQILMIRLFTHGEWVA